MKEYPKISETIELLTMVPPTGTKEDNFARGGSYVDTDAARTVGIGCLRLFAGIAIITIIIIAAWLLIR